MASTDANPSSAENKGYATFTFNLPNDVGWYEVDASCISDNARKLLENWSEIPSDQINNHVNTIREEAFKIYPYPCIGAYRFLDLSIMSSPHYKQIVDRVKGGEKLLDLGCCFGQEVRQLAYDGAPSENLYGTDLRQEFIDLGYDLFQDHKTLKSTFIVADAFDPESPLKQLNGQMSIIYAGSFFHLFDWDGQFAMAKRVVELLKPEPGSMLLGRQAGNINPGEYIRAGYNGERKRWRHDPKTWKEMWELVGKETGTKWDVHAEMEELEFGKSKFVTGEMKLLKQRGEPGTKKLHFVVVRKL